MIDKFNNIASDPEYLKYSNSERNIIRRQWFDENVKKDPEFTKYTPDEQNIIFKQFNNESKQIELENKASLEGTFSSLAKDVAVKGMQGLTDIPRAIIGLGDIVSGGRVGNAAEEAGFNFDRSDREIQKILSAKTQLAEQKTQNADGAINTLFEYVKNPRLIATEGARMAAPMVASGTFGRGVSALSKGRITPLSGMATAEGAQQAGSMAESIRSDTGAVTPKQSLMSLASGVGTGAITVVGGKIANRLGFADVDQLLAGVGINKTEKGIAKRILGGFLTEGVFQELPQGTQEQLWQNAALDKPLWEGVDKAAVQSLVLGGTMGAGANVPGGRSIEGPPPKIDTEINTIKNLEKTTGAFSPQTDTARKNLISQIANGKVKIDRPKASQLSDTSIQPEMDFPDLTRPIPSRQEIPSVKPSMDFGNRAPIIPIQTDNTGLPTAEELSRQRDQGVPTSSQKEQVALSVEQPEQTGTEPTQTNNGNVAASVPVQKITDQPSVETDGVPVSGITDSNNLTLANTGEVAAPGAVSIPDLKTTGQAIDFGKTATPEQVKELDRVYAEKQAEIAKMREANDPNAMEAAMAGQFYREASEVAKGTPLGEKLKAKRDESKKGGEVKANVIDKKPFELSKKEALENPWLLSEEDYAHKVGSPKPTIDIAGDVSFHQLSTMSERAKNDRAKNKASIRASARDKYNSAITEWADGVWSAYKSGKITANDVFDTDAFYVINKNLNDSGIGTKSPFKLSQMDVAERARFLKSVDELFIKSQDLSPTKAAKQEGTSASKTPTLDESGRREDGRAIKPGDVFRTITGGETTPYPKYGLKRTTKRDSQNSAQWLIDNYKAEAERRGDDFNVTLSSAMDAKNFSQADIDSANYYLFGKEQPATIRKSLRPLQADVPPISAQTVTAPAKAEASKIDIANATGRAKIPKAGNTNAVVRNDIAAQVEAEGTPTEAPKTTVDRTKQPDVGQAWDNNKWRPIVAMREITRKGRNQGKFSVTYPDGKKQIVEAKSVRPKEKYATERALYSIDATTLKDIQSFTKGSNSGQSQDGSIWLQIPNGKVITIHNVESITPDKTQFEIGYSRKMTGKERIVGRTIKVGDTYRVELANNLADKHIAEHEIFGHVYNQEGIIPDIDKAALGRAVTGMSNRTAKLILESQGLEDTKENRASIKENTEENRATLIGVVLRDRAFTRQYSPTIGKALQRIADLIDTVINMLHRTARGVLRSMEAGTIGDGYSPAQNERGAVGANAEFKAVDTKSESFKKWFGDSKVVDKNGEPLVVYHWTDYDFTEFDVEGTGGSHFGTKEAAWDRARGMGNIEYEIDEGEDGFYVYADSGPNSGEGQGPFKTKKEATIFVKSQPKKIDPMAVYLSIKSPVRMPDLGVWSFNGIREQLLMQDVITQKEADKIWDGWQKTDPEGWNILRTIMAKNGHDGIVYTNEQEDIGSDSYIALNPTQIKSATTNTGDFSSTNPDIRYAVQAATDPFKAENDRIRETDKTLWSRAKSELKRQLTSRGHLPEDIFDKKIEMEGEFNAIEADVRNLNAVLNKAIKEYYGKRYDRLDDSIKAQLGESLRGNFIGNMPEPIKQAVISMRQYIDGLSLEYSGILSRQAQELLDNGQDAVAKTRGDLLNTIIGNMGEYVHRSYQAFDDKNWYKNIPTEKLNAAREYLRSEYERQGLSEGDIIRKSEVVIEEILKNGTAYDSLENFIASAKLGAKDLSVLKKKKVIAKEIRDLLGEYEDPRLNFSKTATKMGRLFYSQKFLDSVKQSGFGVFLFDETNKPQGATAQIAGDNSEIYSPLNGLWTFPEIKQAFSDTLGKENMAAWYKTAVQLNGYVKMGKTVFSPTTAARNWQSSMFACIANGHFDFKHIKKSVEGLGAHFRDIGPAGVLKYRRELIKEGVLYDNPFAEELFQNISDTQMTGKFLSLKMGAKEFVNYAKKFYRYADDFWKIIGYENEKQNLIETGNFTEVEAKKEAARRIRDMYQTYSLVPKAIKFLGRFPLVGSFVSFPAEIIRTQKNIIKYIAKDFKTPGMKKIALRRVAGMSLVYGMVYGAQALSMTLLGVDNDEDEAVRKLAAPWQKNSNLLYTGRDRNGNIEYIDMSYLDLYNYFKRPINSILRDQPWGQKLTDVFAETLSPFLGADIAAKNIFEVVANKKIDTGSAVYKEHGMPADQIGDIANHLRKGLQPGVASNIERLWKAIDGQSSTSGKKYVLSDELASWAGFRKTTLDPKTSLYYKAFDFTDAKRDAVSVTYRTIRDKNKVSESEIVDAYNQTQKLMSRAYSELAGIIKAAKRSGMTDSQIRATLKNSNISKADVEALLSGKTIKWTPSKSQITKDIGKSSALFGIGKEVGERYGILTKIAIKYKDIE